MPSPTTQTATRTDWYKVSNVDDVASPALLVYPERVEENIRRMIRIAGGVDRLRPHMKPKGVRALNDARAAVNALWYGLEFPLRGDV